MKAEKIVSDGETSILSFQFEKYMEQYQLCNKQIGEMEKVIGKQLDSMYQFQYQLLLSIPGVGISIASVVLAYLGIIQRFKNVRKFWSYYGMAPKVRESDGKKVGSGGITKMGPSILRGYLTQGALSILKNKEKKDNKPLVEFLTHQYGLSFSPLGNQYVCLSPFTEDQKPSFTVGQFDGRWLFKDFSSGHGGSLIDFVLLKENFGNVGQSIAHLRKSISGDKLDWLQSQKSGSGMGEKKKKEGGGGDYNLNYIYRKLCINEKEVCWKYLNKRGIGQELISELSNF